MTKRKTGLWLIGACGGVGGTATLGLAALARGTPGARQAAALRRMDLTQPRGFAARLQQRLLVLALDATRTM